MRIPLTLLLSLTLVSNFGSDQWSQQYAATDYVIERLEFVGARRVESATLRMKVSSKPGQSYNAEQVERDAQGLRDTGFFDEVRAEVKDSPDQPNAKIVAFYLRERPIILRIEYRGIRSLNTQDLLRAYKEQKIGLSEEPISTSNEWSEPQPSSRTCSSRMGTHPRRLSPLRNNRLDEYRGDSLQRGRKAKRQKSVGPSSPGKW